jgi:tetratricopeptide (TPR) repeat protein
VPTTQGGAINAPHRTSDVVGQIGFGQEATGLLDGIEGSAGFHTYILTVPQDTALITIHMEADEDLDLAAKHGSEIVSYTDDGDWDYLDTSFRNSARFVIQNPEPGRWFIDVANLLGEGATGRYTLVVERETTAQAVPPSEADAYLQRGLQTFNRGDFAGAVDEYSMAIDFDPELAIAYLGRCEAYYELFLSSQAVEDCTEVIDLTTAQDDIEARASAFFLRGSSYMDLGIFDSAIEDYSQILELQPENINALMNRSYALALQGLYQPAMADIEQVLQLDDSLSYAYFMRGDLRLNMGKSELAIADLTTAIELDPYAIDAYNTLGSLYADLGRLTDAIADFTRFIELEPDSPVAYYFRGSMHGAQWEWGAAIADYTRSLERAETVEAYIDRGQAYSHQGDFDRAIQDATAAIELNPGFALAYNNRAYYLFLTGGDLDQALTDVNQALALMPDEASFLDTRGSVYLGQGKPDLAIADLTRALAIYPDYLHAYSHRARAYLESGLISEAMEDCNRALELGSPDPSDSVVLGETYYTRGLAHAALGQSGQALEDFEIALEHLTDPEVREAIQNEIAGLNQS